MRRPASRKQTPSDATTFLKGENQNENARPASGGPPGEKDGADVTWVYVLERFNIRPPKDPEQPSS
jgi:hypothetical protein